ncbi:ubiquitin-conjugating enzyme E2 J1 [Exophiala aquamarina CBS 119918]|uniref:Ubiquitin-conjugating enzyme E2 J1 n=1 Tax=Exophiala aquamarina CBS 119918 TaxID=1182545 RepID=A0A072P969_9EURO|nr:ubiquitin-conjugating enzyme E2 J1 [Exophiala aquamarina CBS 119918]KEF55803.1 ubiquitin-conjugating enzyme E2 J1 [Exophiala aquamarina CBS 119918]
MAPSPTIRRLLKETAELSSPSSSPNPAFYAAPVSDADLHDWHFTLLGPPAPSPYAGGMYHGRITLPPTYPLKPPNFRFLTPSGRFEVNREICLSISGFHEETWMPAWGVRTALTALRSFMAEQGTAGQVGGLEASKEVRSRLAKESRTWRCDACKKTNETIMREWWDICHEAGLDVQEEELGLEALPEGMNLEARASKAQEQRARESSHQEGQHEGRQRQETQVPSIISLGQRDPTSQPQTHTDPHTPPRSQTHSRSISTSTSSLVPGPIPLVPTPSAEATQARAEAVLTASELSPTGRSTRPLSSLHSQSTPLAAATATTTNHSAQSLLPQRLGGRNREQQAITIDRAIAGVFLALCLMVLKKIFFPAGSGASADALTRNEFYLQRE